MPTDDELKKGKLTVTRKDIENPTGDDSENETLPDLKVDDLGERMDRDYQMG
jgi:hypothetical protein